MADDWEDWEDEQFEPTLPGTAKTAAGQPDTLGAALLAKAKEPDASKFAGEDEDVEDDPLRKRVVPPPQQACQQCYTSLNSMGTLADRARCARRRKRC